MRAAIWSFPAVGLLVLQVRREIKVRKVSPARSGPQVRRERKDLPVLRGRKVTGEIEGSREQPGPLVRPVRQALRVRGGSLDQPGPLVHGESKAPQDLRACKASGGPQGLQGSLDQPGLRAHRVRLDR
jgi:hypothetical protein